jgi:hypothetical protein
MRISPARHVCGTCMPERVFATRENARRHVRKYHRDNIALAFAILLRVPMDEVDEQARLLIAANERVISPWRP